MLNKEVKKQVYIFVTGGVVSGIGKGICAASVGHLLKQSGLSVEAMKLDPYLNVDPGTMSPYEHGEVFVLKDGKETDLDLGNYERFLDVELTKDASYSSGSIYSTILDKERAGDYLGKTVQIIPNVTDYIQSLFLKSDSQVKIIEIGGSTGDMEAEVYLESLRQFKTRLSKQVYHVHLGYIPFLKVVGEYKSKPLQNSNKELLRLGLKPDLLVLRYEKQDNKDLSKALLEKIALHCNLSQDEIIELPDLDSIYSVPEYLLKNSKVLKQLSILTNKTLKPKLEGFYLENHNRFDQLIKVALIAKYSGLQDSYYSVIEALKMSAFAKKTRLEVQILDSTDPELLAKLKFFDGFVVPGGFGTRGLEDKIKAIQWIRENKKPFLGICLGLQMAVLEFLRNKTKQTDAQTAENPLKNDKSDFAIDYMANQKELQKSGATMRLGNYNCTLEKKSLAAKLYGKNEIIERHRHRLEVSNNVVPDLEEAGMIVSGKHLFESGFLVELVELSQKNHPFFIATQSHPEFLARPNRPHPLFNGLIEACLEK
jgi:CTP synthase